MLAGVRGEMDGGGEMKMTCNHCGTESEEMDLKAAAMRWLVVHLETCQTYQDGGGAMSETICNQHRWEKDLESYSVDGSRPFRCGACHIPAPTGLRLYSEDAGVTWTEIRPVDWPELDEVTP